MIKTPVLFIIFNRPEVTAKAFETIKEFRPTQLFIAADGPREGLNEEELCLRARSIATQVNWPCDVHTLFRESNLGCGLSVSIAISWFFDHVEHGIILEDDCVANNSFFSFCSDLLIKYNDEKQVMMISGCSFQNKAYDHFSYYYTRYVHVWGWATWRRAWKLYDFELKGFNPDQADNYLKKVFKTPAERSLWIRNVTNAINGTIDTWDYQWMYTIWKNNGLCIVPWKNLISNIGYGNDATHTVGFDPNTNALPTHFIKDIKHPLKLIANERADRYIRYKVIISKTGLVATIKKILKKIINHINV